jgi:dolichol-phosphate mannosyltransferase
MYKTGTTTPKCAMSHIYFLLPAYNEEENLPGLFQAIDESVENYRIILVDDGSSDRTGRIARDFASKIPITILTHKKNEGLGAALNTGFRYIAENGEENSVIVTMDSDLTHDPAMVPSMMEELEKGYDVVVTSRYVKGGAQYNLSLSRRVLSRGINTLLRMKGSRVLDNTSGFRCMKIEVLQKALEKYKNEFITSTEFTSTVEVLLRLQGSGAKVKEVPIDLDYGKKGGESKMKVGRTIRTYLSMLSKSIEIPAQHEKRRFRKPKLGTFIRFLIGIGLLVVVIWYSQPAYLWSIISGASLPLLLLAAGIHIIATSANAAKISYLCDKTERFTSIFKANLGGMLLADVTPGRSGYFVTPIIVNDMVPELEKGKVLNSIFFTQIFEFLLRGILLVAAMLTIFYSLGVSQNLYLYGILSLVLVAVLSIGFFVLAFNKVPGFMIPIINRIPFVSSLYQRYIKYVGSIDYTPKKSGVVFILTILGWLLTALRWIIVGYALGLDIPIVWYLFLFPALTAASFIPISLSGLGIVEGGFALVFFILGSSTGVGVAFSLVDRSMALLGDLTGISYATKVGTSVIGAEDRLNSQIKEPEG